MPSAFAHAFVGASLAAALPPGGSNGRAALVLAAAAAAPALDVLGFGLGIPYESPLGHRGLTHSLFSAAGASIVANEALWIGLPARVFASLTHALRAVSSRR